MVKHFLSGRFAAAVLTALSMGACGGDTSPAPGSDGGLSRDGGASGGDGGAMALSAGGLITSNVSWPAGATVTLTRPTVVVSPAVLTIGAGATVKGQAGSYLLVARGAKLRAEGTASAPIVFTSAKPATTRRPGDWGGVVLLGRASINVAGGQNAVEGIPAGLMLDGQTVDTQYGGTDDADDSGTLRFARIEFAGFELSPDNELNGLTLGGVGSGTTIDYVQVHRGADDGVECFGGTVNLKHVIVSYTNDDGLDVDLGYRGKVQYLVILQDKDGNTAYEWDNNRSANDAMPRTMPTIYNATLVGSRQPRSMTQQDQPAMVIRRGAAGHMFNHLVMGFQLQAVDVRDAATAAQANATPATLFVRNSIFFENGTTVGGDFPTEVTVDGGLLPDNDSGFLEAGHFMAGATNNRMGDPQLPSAFDIAAPRLLPNVGSPALTGGATPPTDGFFDTTATHVGAFGTTDWTAGWTAYPAN